MAESCRVEREQTEGLHQGEHAAISEAERGRSGEIAENSATAFGIYDRGLLQLGMAADLVVFDPDSVQPVTGDVVHDFPDNGWRMRELAEGIHYTVVNGEVLLEKGAHTGSYPGRVLHNARYHGAHNGRG